MFPWQGLYQHKTTQHNTNIRGNIPIPQAGFEPENTEFERSETMHKINRSCDDDSKQMYPETWKVTLETV
jgi:hypothetical protein